MTPRSRIYQERKPQAEPGFEEIQRVDAFNSKAVDPRFLKNQHLPIDPKIVEEKQRAYLEELERWSQLDTEYHNEP